MVTLPVLPHRSKGSPALDFHRRSGWVMVPLEARWGQRQCPTSQVTGQALLAARGSWILEDETITGQD